MVGGRWGHCAAGMGWAALLKQLLVLVHGGSPESAGLELVVPHVRLLTDQPTPRGAGGRGACSHCCLRIRSSLQAWARAGKRKDGFGLMFPTLIIYLKALGKILISHRSL